MSRGPKRPDDGFVLERANIPHRRHTPEPDNFAPVGRRTVHSSFQSYRSGWSVPYWGEGQFAVLAHMEIDPAVRWMRSRPEGVEFFDGERWAEHVAAFEFGTASGSVYADVLDRDEAAATRSSEAVGRIREAVARRGAVYRIFIRQVVTKEPILTNALLIGSCGHPCVPTSDVNRVSSAIPAAGTVRAGELVRMAGLPEDEGLAAAWRLAWLGHLDLDMGPALGPDTRVWRTAR